MCAATPITIAVIQEAIASRSTTAIKLVEHTLTRIDALNPSLNAILSTMEDDARARAEALDARLDQPDYVPGPLAGVPLLVKDNICMDRGKTTCASRFLADYRSPFTATCVRRLEAAGAIPIAKTNLDEFAMGSSGEHSHFGLTRNPHDPDRVPGGSSSGSAAAVAARIAGCALGSDTGGSIRQPAAFTGCVGLKPTYGRISRWGLVAFASSLDQIGPITTTVSDAAALLDILAGPDPLDSTSAPIEPPNTFATLEQPVEQLRLGVPSEARSEANNPSVRRAFDDALDAFRSLGAEIIDIHLPNLDAGISTYYLVATAEASSNLARYDGIRYGRRADIADSETLDILYARSRSEGFGPEVQRRIMLGTHALSSGYYDAYYLTALKARRLIKNDFDRAFYPEDSTPGVHAILMPTAPTPAFPIGAKTGDPLSMYLEDIYTVGANLAGIPSISLPMGTADSDGARLPLGLQILAPAFEESMLLRIARMYEPLAPPTPLAPCAV